MKASIPIAIIIILVLVFLNQCSGEEKQMIMTQKVYTGTMNGKHPFEMSIHREGDKLSGFVLNTYKQKAEIKGKVDGDDVFIINEFNGDQKTVIFSGRFIPGGEIKGTWSTPDGKKWNLFYLLENTK